MNTSIVPRWTRARRLAATALAAAVPLVSVAVASPAAADTAPPVATTPTTVSADVLPTAQVNGVVWAQLVVGNTVYATGEFTSARPAGAAVGTGETPRSNIIAYDLTTGVMSAAFAPSLNAQGLTLAASADGATIYVGGDFTAVNGVNRYRIAALDAATGALRPSFTAGLDARVRTIVARDGVLYTGGIFTTAANQPRTRLAAFDAATGALNPWAPTADDEVMAMVAPPNTGKIVVGGRFANLNGAANYGMGALDAATAAVLPWPVNTIVRNGGDATAIYNLTADGTQVYGTGYTFGAGGNLENSFAADSATGNLKWVVGCRGDTYSGMPIGSVYYVVGHSHDCSQIGAFPQTNPWTYQRAMALSTDQGAGSKVNVSGNFTGRPAPDLYHWLPTLAPGTYTGQSQAAWSVAGNNQYVVLAGEFPSINGVAQQGLARFTVRSGAPNLEGPQGYSTLTPTLTGLSAGVVRARWTAAWDRDNTRLTYELLRGAQLSTATVVGTTTLDNNWWTRPAMTLTDPTAPPGTSQSYRVRVKDPLGNIMVSTTAVVTVPAGTTGSRFYRDAVKADGASSHWRLGEASGTVAYSAIDANDLTLGAASQRGVAGGIVGDSDLATTFPGSDTVPASTTGTAVAGPQTFSVEAWFKTTSTTGGKIIGFGNKNNASSTTFDRHVYLTNAGKLVFGVNPGAVRTVASPLSYNDGTWHHVVGTLGGGGLTLFVDGAQVANRTDTTSAQAFNGYWRVAGDTVSASWPTRPTTANLNGSIDEVAVYPAALAADKVASHWNLGRGNVPNAAPTAAFTSTTADLTASFDGSTSTDSDGTVAGYAWDFGDGQAGTGVTVPHAYAAAGTYTVRLTVTDNGGATGTTTKSVTVTAPPTTGATIAADSFTRTVASGFGTADTGGAWTFSGAGTTASVGPDSGLVAATAGKTATLRLPSVNNQDNDVTHLAWLEQAPTGGGEYLSTVLRSTAGGDYRARLRFLATGEVQTSLTKVVSGTETALTTSVTIPGLTYTAGTKLSVRAQAVGANPTTLQLKVWVAGGAEPAAWQQTVTDSTAGLQASGGVGFVTFLSGSATATVNARFDDLKVVKL